MRRPKPKCYACGKRASWSIMFCSMKCAAHITLELFEGTDDWSWCPACNSWVNENPRDCVDRRGDGMTGTHSHWTPGAGWCYGKPISLSEYEVAV